MSRLLTPPRAARVVAALSLLLAIPTPSARAEEAPADADAPAQEPAPAPAPARRSASGAGDDLPNAFVLEGAMRVDVQRLDRYDRVNRIEIDESDSGRSVGGSLYLGLMFGIRENMRVGGGFGWGGSLEVDPDGGDAIGLGQMLFLDLRLDVLLPVKDDIDVILTPRLGASIIAPGDELRAIINNSRSSGFDTWRGPRFGLVVGADAGIRWKAASWFALRGTLGYVWSWSPLLRSSASTNFATAEREWTLTTHRLRIAVGAEVTF